MIIQIGFLFVFSSDSYIISYVFNPTEIVPYEVVSKLFQLPYLVLFAALTPFWSLFAKHYLEKNQSKLLNDFNKFNKFFSLFIEFVGPNSTGIIKNAANLGKSATFYDGGRVPYGTGGTITGQNIPTQRGGDNILATVKSGEVILNEQQQQRAGGSAFFNSIGVPGFDNGGLVGSIPSNIQSPLTQAGTNGETMARLFAEQINNIKVVAIVDEITSGINLKAEIIDGANI